MFIRLMQKVPSKNSIEGRTVWSKLIQVNDVSYTRRKVIDKEDNGEIEVIDINFSGSGFTGSQTLWHDQVNYCYIMNDDGKTIERLCSLKTFTSEQVNERLFGKLNNKTEQVVDD